MLDVTILNENEEPVIKKITVGEYTLIFDDSGYSEDPLYSIILLKNSQDNTISKGFKLFRIDPDDKADREKQKNICNRLITALQFIERNWFE